jgi:hypothetical protein
MRSTFNKKCKILNSSQSDRQKQTMGNDLETSQTLWSALFYHLFQITLLQRYNKYSFKHSLFYLLYN